MRVAFFGDIVGKTGRQKLESSLNQYVSSEKIDFVVVNAENPARPPLVDRKLSNGFDISYILLQ